jgi:hypothetical protein
MNELMKYIKNQRITIFGPTESSLLAEYQTAQDFALHADNTSWQIGSILISGVLISFSFLADRRADPLFFYIAILLVNIILSVWLHFFQNQHQIMRVKLKRIRDIENELGLKQNFYWELERNCTKYGKYRTYGPGGKKLVKIIFLALSLSSIIYGALTINNNYDNYTSFGKYYSISFVALSLIIVCATYVGNCIHEKMFNAYMLNLLD